MQTDYKIIYTKLNKFNTLINENIIDINKYFGNWINDIDTLRQQFINAKPFEHIIIPNFLNEKYAEAVYSQYPNDFEMWHKYYNPLEVKYANDNINDMCKDIKNIFYLLSTDLITNLFRNISTIDDLEHDPFLHGAGLHVHPRYGRLNMHLDYEKHPISGKQRRLNVILYLSKNWKKEWNGDTQLWDKDMNECIVSSQVKFNHAIIFKTNDISWHGLPEKILCPENVYRKTLAYYYVSPLISEYDEKKTGNDGSGYRTKAVFVKRPNEPEIPALNELYKIRPLRRIEQTDLNELWKEWTPDIF